MASDTDYGAGWDAGYEEGFIDGKALVENSEGLTLKQATTLDEMRDWFLRYNRQEIEVE